MENVTREKIFFGFSTKKHRPALPQGGAVGSLGTILSNISMLLDDVHALFNQIIPDEFGKGNRTVFAARAAECNHQTAFPLFDVERNQEVSRSSIFCNRVLDCSNCIT